jgi:hypothetical protein
MRHSTAFDRYSCKHILKYNLEGRVSFQDNFRADIYLTNNYMPETWLKRIANNDDGSDNPRSSATGIGTTVLKGYGCSNLLSKGRAPLHHPSKLHTAKPSICSTGENVVK